MARAHPIRSLIPVIALALTSAACSKAPAEPEPQKAAASSAPAVAPLAWDPPGTWTVLPVPPTGVKKAAYKVPKVANDKEEAEVNVVFLGTGEKGDPTKVFKEWFDQFDGNVGPGAKREQFDVKAFKIETVEVNGTFKMSLAPPVGPKKKSPVQMVKEGYRLYGAVVKTPERGNWYFRMTGPDETVQSARSAMRAMLESVR